MVLTAEQLQLVSVRARNMSERVNISREYSLDLRHIASDAQGALDGCDACMNSVIEYLKTDHELEMVLY